jgi:hypothetical protein
MQQTLGGRPVRLEYSSGERVQFNISLPREVKRALAESAERNDRRLGDEARLALSEWVGTKDRSV